MSRATAERRRPDPYRLTRNRFIPRPLRLPIAATWANRLIAEAKELFDTRREAPCAECRMWEHYDLSVTITHLIHPAGTKPEEWQDCITPLLDRHETGQHHATMWREVFFRDAYEDVSVEFECEIENCASQRRTQLHMIRCIEHDLIMCAPHWSEHDRKIHGHQACEHLLAQVATAETTHNVHPIPD